MGNGMVFHNSPDRGERQTSYAEFAGQVLVENKHPKTLKKHGHPAPRLPDGCC